MNELPHQLSADALRHLQGSGTSAFRLGSASDRWIEYFNRNLLLSAPSEKDFAGLLSMATALCQKLDLPRDRCYGRILSKNQDGKTAPSLLHGPAPESPQCVVTENHLHYQLDFSAGYSTGLFPDQRHNRQYLTSLQPRQLLNCFAYTCAFSVAAAAAGAQTVSIDVAGKALDWGRRNFELNNLSLAGHRFLADDVRDCLPRLARRGEKFDCIVLDPPTFARSHKGKVFQVENEMPQLVRLALDCLSPGGRVLVSTNCRQLNPRALEELLRSVLAGKGRPKLHAEPPPADFPAWAMPATLWINS